MNMKTLVFIVHAALALLLSWAFFVLILSLVEG
jgi:hypothetical protein